MTVTDELLANNATYVESFEGPLPLPPARQLAVVACMDARIKASPFIPKKDSVRGFVLDVATGRLDEVS